MGKPCWQKDNGKTFMCFASRFILAKPYFFCGVTTVRASVQRCHGKRVGGQYNSDGGEKSKRSPVHLLVCASFCLCRCRKASSTLNGEKWKKKKRKQKWKTKKNIPLACSTVPRLGGTSTMPLCVKCCISNNYTWGWNSAAVRLQTVYNSLQLAEEEASNVC